MGPTGHKILLQDPDNKKAHQWLTVADPDPHGNDDPEMIKGAAVVAKILLSATKSGPRTPVPKPPKMPDTRRWLPPPPGGKTQPQGKKRLAQKQHALYTIYELEEFSNKQWQGRTEVQGAEPVADTGTETCTGATQGPQPTTTLAPIVNISLTKNPLAEVRRLLRFGGDGD